MAALVQQSPEWLEMRKNYVGASDAPIIMQVSKWKSPYDLWLEKLGLTESSYKSAAMQRGIELEDKARQSFIEHTGIKVSPDVKFSNTHDFMMCSLDGISSDMKTIVEIKCPGATDHEMAKMGHIPEKYFPQLQHQLEVCELDMAYYFSFDGKDGVTLKIYRDDAYIEKLIAKEREFWDCITGFVAPKLTEKDYHQRDDQIWEETAKEWSLTNKQLSTLESKEKELRDSLICMTNNQNTVGAGVKLSRIARKGAIDYSKIPQLSEVDLEQYRKNPTIYWKISEVG